MSKSFFFFFFFAFFLKSSLLPAFLIYLYEVYFLIHLFISSFLLLLPIHDERRFFFLSRYCLLLCVPSITSLSLLVPLMSIASMCQKYLSTRKAKWKSSERKYEKEKEKKNDEKYDARNVFNVATEFLILTTYSSSSFRFLFYFFASIFSTPNCSLCCL